ncbi:MAG: hypothetical protein HZB51_02525 [Chloroflexi bacterium]|nr:hypothetical protein [Chloroflexota bacterium]
MSAEPPQTRVLRQIVFGYTIDCFPGSLILGHHQLKRMIERAGFDVKVEMLPLTELPPNVDILIVPAELAEPSRQFASQCHVEILHDMANHPMYGDLIRQLEAGTAWSAARMVEPTSAEDGGQIMRYRGYERIE